MKSSGSSIQESSASSVGSVWNRASVSSIRHAVRGIGIGKPISKCAARTCKRPIRWLPRVRPPADAEYRPYRFNAERNCLTSRHKRANGAKDLRSHDFEIAIAHEPYLHAFVQLGIKGGQPSLYH